MHARVATFADGEPGQVAAMIEGISRQLQSGPPEGVPLVGGIVLHNAAERRVVAISLFETEADLREGDATLSAVDPPVPGGLGRRVSVETYEVALKLDL